MTLTGVIYGASDGKLKIRGERKYLLTPYSIEKLTVTQLVKILISYGALRFITVFTKGRHVTQLVKILLSYGTRRFITVFTKGRHWTLS
jgi:hypothetical protein